MTSLYRDSNRVRFDFDNNMDLRADLHDTVAGPVSTEMYGKGLRDLCTRTQNNLNRLSYEMKKMDHYPRIGLPSVPVTDRSGKWENLDVMFTDFDSTQNLSNAIDEGLGDYVDPPVPYNRFCYLCSTMEEHKKHMLHHKPPKRPSSAKPRVEYIAPKPKVKRKHDEEEEFLVKERLYKVEVFTSDVQNAGTSAKVFISIKGSIDVLPRTQLVKKRGCANFCFVQGSREVFHIMGPLLGNLQALTVEHDGRKKFHGWHLDRMEITDVKALKTWVFYCGEWISMFEKPHYSNIIDLKAEEKHKPLTEYDIEVYTGKKQMAGTDANIYIMLFGEQGASKKIHLVDNTKDKQLFEKNSVDKFRFRMHSLGNLSKLRIEHDGKGLGAGWFLEKVIIKDSTRPKDTFYFLYHGWIAKDEGEGKLWREIKAKKVLPKEMQQGEKTRYNISVKTSDIRYAGTDANVFIQIAGVEGGITPKLKLDDAKNNFERNMVDNFEVDAFNVGVIDHIIIGHDNFGPGAGWHLEKVTIRRYVPKSEARERVKKVKKRLKKEKKVLRDRFSNRVSGHDTDDDNVDDDGDDRKQRKKLKDKTNKNTKENDETVFNRRPSSAMGRRDRYWRTGSGRLGRKNTLDSDDEYTHVRGRIRYGEKNVSDSDEDYDTGRNQCQSPGRGKARKEWSEDEISSKQIDDLYTVSTDESGDESTQIKGGKNDNKGRPGSALRRQSQSISERRNSKLDRMDNRRSSSASSLRRPSSALSQSLSERRTSTSASSLRKREEEENRKNKKGKKKVSDDEEVNLDEPRVPLYEEYLFMCNKWLAKDEDDGLFVRELPVTSKTVFYKD